jgi:glycolate oxidase FAD binding subunit
MPAVARPATISEAVELMRDRDLAVVFRGAGTTLRQGPPPTRCDLVIDTRSLDGLVEHAAGDLVVKVQAGHSMTDLQEVLAKAGQQLAVDHAGTVGGAIAAAAAGPRRLLYGTVRDLLIGVTIIRADGVLARAGGKVVKNVAGYDLGKLFTGSRGTLGLIVEAAFRLHPLPRAFAYVGATAADAGAAHSMVQALLGSSLVPAAIELDAPVGGPIVVMALFEGVPDGVAARARAARSLLGGDARISDGAPAWWGHDPAGEILVEVRTKPTELRPLMVSNDCGVALRGSAGNGVWRLGLPADAEPERVLSGLRSRGWRSVLLVAPPAVFGEVDAWGRVAGLTLMRRVKDQFDPDHRLSPGRFVGGI